MKRVYEVDGTEYECLRAFKFIDDDLSEIDAEEVSDADMYSIIKAIKDADEADARADAEELASTYGNGI